jgi:hypothetical protein
MRRQCSQQHEKIKRCTLSGCFLCISPSRHALVFLKATIMAEASAESIPAPTTPPPQETQREDEQQPAASASTTEKMESLTESNIRAVVTPWLSAFVWPLIVSLPLVLSSSWSPISYKDVFPAEWYDIDIDTSTSAVFKPKPLGLILGIIAVIIGQNAVITFFYLYKFGHLSSTPGQEPTLVQRSKAFAPYQFKDAVASHLFQPEGFVLLGVYLATTWMFHLMPNSYYSFDGSIQWRETFLCLVLQDGFQFTMVSTVLKVD